MAYELDTVSRVNGDIDELLGEAISTLPFEDIDSRIVLCAERYLDRIGVLSGRLRHAVSRLDPARRLSPTELAAVIKDLQVEIGQLPVTARAKAIKSGKGGAIGRPSAQPV